MIRANANLIRNASNDDLLVSLFRRTIRRSKQGMFEPTCVGATGCGFGDGVSTCSANLAQFSADRLKLDTLLVDMSIGEKLFETTHGASDSKVGALQVLQGRGDLEEAIRSTPSPRLSYLASGLSPQEPWFTAGEISQLESLIKTLRADFQYVVFDMSPVGGATCSLPLARLLDAVFIVVQPGKTLKSNAAATSWHLKKSGANVVGAMANRVNKQLPSLGQLVRDISSGFFDILR